MIISCNCFIYLYYLWILLSYLIESPKNYHFVKLMWIILQLFNYRNWLKLPYHFWKCHVKSDWYIIYGLSSKFFKLSPVNSLKLRSFACNYISLLSLNTKNGSDIRLLYCGDRYASLKNSVLNIALFCFTEQYIHCILFIFQLLLIIIRVMSRNIVIMHHMSVTHFPERGFCLWCVLTDVFNTFVSFSTCKL